MTEQDQVVESTKPKKSLSAIEKLGFVVGALIVVLVGADNLGWIPSKETGTPTVNSDRTAISRAEQIILGNLINPDGYERRSAAVVWTGSTRSGKPMSGVKVDYNVRRHDSQMRVHLLLHGGRHNQMGGQVWS